MTERSDNPGTPARAHPPERFAAAAQSFDLVAAAAELSRETTPGHGGHRQKMLYRHGGLSLALFVFEAGSTLREHRTSGTVLIQVLQGQLTVGAAGERHNLPAGQVLTLTPGIAHDLRAEQRTHMLLTVSLDPPAADHKS
jgi:quercetin dioxygenase-like cupin family protein